MASRAAAPLMASFTRHAPPRTLRATTSFRTTLRPLGSPSSPSSFVRLAHTIPRPPRKQHQQQQQPQNQQPSDEPNSDGNAAASAQGQPAKHPPDQGEHPEFKSPAYYQLSFTCVPCGQRSHHNVSKQGYHFGSTLITCPRCRNRHVISDHLNIFGDRKITVEDLMRERGQLVKKGNLGEDGDIEFWPDEPLP